MVYGPTPKLTNPYSQVKAFVRDPSPHKAKLTTGRHYDFLRIARLGDAWGNNLDRLGVSYKMLRWIAGAADPRFIVEREQRYQAIVTLLENGGGNREFLRLAAETPKIGRAAKRAA